MTTTNIEVRIEFYGERCGFGCKLMEDDRFGYCCKCVLDGKPLEIDTSTAKHVYIRNNSCKKEAKECK